MVQRCACVLLAEYQSRHGIVPAGIIAEALSSSRLLPTNVASVEKEIAKMQMHGSYYRSLENALGKGATLAFGTDMAETM